MIGYLITYGDDLTQAQANKRLKEVLVGATIVISLYLLLTQAANAANGKILPDAHDILPAAELQTNSIGKRLSAGLTTTVCSTAVNTDSFWIGVTCDLIVVAEMIMTPND